jgi:hypothetical protein
MNNSNAAARKRRAPPVSEPVTRQINPQSNVSLQQSQQSQQPVGGHTLPQVISIIDNRLLMIEKKLKEDPVSRSVDNNSDLSELQNEYEERFDMILREIDSIKEIVIKLQAYTMDVNKILVEEHTANKIILEKEKEFHHKVLEQVDHTHKALMDMVVANNTERLNEYKETNKELLIELKRITELNARISTIGEHSTKINSFNQSAHKIQIDATPVVADKDDDDVDEDDDDELPTLEASLDTECEKDAEPDTTTDTTAASISFGTVSGNTATKPKNRRYKMKD